MSKEESFKEYWNMFGNPDSAIIRYSCLHTWNHQQAKLDKANKENKQLKEALKLAVEVIRGLIDKTEYGVNQWQAAWLPDEETASQKSIREARQFLESEQYKKVEGSL